jgi:hypothetical protein
MKSGSLSYKSLSKVLLPAAVAGFLLTNNNAPAQVQTCPETNGVKFIALPAVNGGLDVRDSRNNIVLADDFYCNTTGPITDIHIWGSWSNDYYYTSSITNFWLGIYDDVPATTNLTGGPIPSHPGTNLLWSQSFIPGQFWETFYTSGNESFYDPTTQTFAFDSQVWYYCFYPTNPFVQQGQLNSPTNYWLAARAQLDPNDGTLYGWKTAATCNYNDAAVWGTVGKNGLPTGDWQSMTNPTTQLPINLAFKITTAVQPIPCVDTNGVKYLQAPNLMGLDVWNSSAQPSQVSDGPWWLADDFVCTNSGRITDLHLWGSWLNDNPLSNSITFQLYVLDNVPTNSVNPFSHPGTNVLWHQTFSPGFYAESVWSPYASESFLDPGVPEILGGDKVVWYYCFYPTNLWQYGSATQPSNYWLAAFAELPRCATNVFGWKTTTNVQHDISVHALWSGYNVPPPNNVGAWQPNYEYPYQYQPFDLAFSLTTSTNPCPLPVIECSNQVIECGTPWTITPPPVSDQCCPPPIPVATPAAVPVTNGTSVCSQVITLAWKYTDCQERTVYCTNTVTVHDTTPPVLYCTNLVLACGDHSYTNPPTAYDTCCGSNVTVIPLGSTTVSNGCGYTIYQTWQATDCCNNTNQCIRMVSIVPGLGLQNLVVPNANANVQGNSANGFPFDTGGGTLRYQQVYDASQFGAVPPGGAYITALAFRVGKTYGAFAETLPGIRIDLSTTYTGVPDGLSTTFANNVGPDDTVVYNGSLDLSSAAIGSPAAFDIIVPLTTPFWYNPLDGGDLLLDVRNSGGGASPTEFDAVLTTGDSVSRVYGALAGSTGTTDTLGLVTEFTLGVGTVNLACSSNLTITCGTPIPTNPPAVLDACCSNVTVTLGSSPVTYGPCEQTIYQNWSAVDCCGYVTNCTRIIQVLDTNPPVFSGCVAAKAVECNSGSGFDTPTASYFCSGSNVFVGILNTVTNSVGPCTSVQTRTWAATNACSGAVATCAEVLTILDTNPPVFSGCFTAKTVECGSGLGFDTPTASYLCSSSNVFVGIVSTITNSFTACTNVQTRTWAATNACSGAVATCAEVLTTIDTIAPTIVSCPTNMVVYTCDNNPVVVPWSTNASDTCSSVTVTSVPPYGTPFPPNSTNTVVLSAHDACGNSNGCTFTVTVRRPVLGTITYTVVAPNLILQWTYGILQQAPTVLGPWTDVPGAVSPQPMPLSSAEQFFRLRCASP